MNYQNTSSCFYCRIESNKRTIDHNIHFFLPWIISHLKRLQANLWTMEVQFDQEEYSPGCHPECTRDNPRPLWTQWKMSNNKLFVFIIKFLRLLRSSFSTLAAPIVLIEPRSDHNTGGIMIIILRSVPWQGVIQQVSHPTPEETSFRASSSLGWLRLINDDDSVSHAIRWIFIVLAVCLQKSLLQASLEVWIQFVIAPKM